MKLKISDIIFLKKDFPDYEVEYSPCQVSLDTVALLLRTGLVDTIPSDIYNVNDIGDFERKIYVESDLEGIKTELDNVEQGLFNFCHDILEDQVVRFGVPGISTWNLFLLVFYNVFIDIKDIADNTDIFDFYSNFSGKNINERLHPYYEDRIKARELILLIAIKREVTKNQLINWINEKWDDINVAMKKCIPAKRVDQLKFKDIAIADEILSLHEEGKSIGDISSLLTDKHPLNNNVMSEYWTKQKLHRYKKFLSKIHEDTYREDLHQLLLIEWHVKHSTPVIKTESDKKEWDEYMKRYQYLKKKCTR